MTPLFFLASDAAAFLLAVPVTQLLLAQTDIDLHFAVWFYALAAFGLLKLNAAGHYRERLSFWPTLGYLSSLCLTGFVLQSAAGFLLALPFSRAALPVSWLLAAALLILGRMLVCLYGKRYGSWALPVLLIGDGLLAETAWDALRRDGFLGFTLAAQLSADRMCSLATPEDWRQLLAHTGASHIVAALAGSEWDKHQDALKALARSKAPCAVVPPWQGLLSTRLQPTRLMMRDTVLLREDDSLNRLLPNFAKRTFDIVGAGILSLLSLPLLLFLAVQVRRDGGPALFKQQRVGRGGKLFLCCKFRTMRDGAEAALDSYLASHPEKAEEWQRYQKLSSDERVTRFGMFLRRTSLDELPQLINVLRGEMSLVGPRPILPDQSVYYDKDLADYARVRPGITGPWQVCGRNTLTFRERVALECSYARNWSFWLDLVILLKTLPAVLKKDQVH